MLKKTIALLLITLILGVASPVLAGDAVSPNLPPFSVKNIRVPLPGNVGAFGLPQHGQAATTPALATRTGHHWTKKGKVLTVVGLGVGALGGYMMTQEDQTSAYMTANGDIQQQKLRMKVAGGIVLGTGAVLSIFGLTRRGE